MNEIRFNLRKNKEKNPLIQLVYRFNGKKLVMSTKLNVPYKYWDKKRMKAKISIDFSGNSINTKLRDYETALRKAERYFSERSIIPSVLEFKEKIYSIATNGKSDIISDIYVLPYIDKYIQLKKESGKVKNGTIQSYMQLYKAFSKYIKTQTIEFQDLNETYLLSFHSFMKETLAYSINQREKLQRRLSEIIKESYNRGIHNNRIFNSRSWKINKKENENIIYLTNEEINLIKNYSFHDKKVFEGVRDRWIIGFRTGQRFSDFKNLNKDNIIKEGGKELIEIVQQKTFKKIKIPLFQDIKDIFNKYQGYPPVYSSQYFNKIIKMIAKEIGINEEVINYSDSDKNDTEGKKIPKFELITSHICRRSFATNAIIKGISPAMIMKVTGHSNLQTFSKYIKLSIDDVGNALDDIFG